VSGLNDARTGHHGPDGRRDIRLGEPNPQFSRRTLSNLCECGGDEENEYKSRGHEAFHLTLRSLPVEFRLVVDFEIG